MRKVDRFGIMLESFGCDRWVHLNLCLVVSWLSSLIFRLIAYFCSLPTENAITGLVGVGVGVMFAIGKDVYDKKTTDLFDIVDVTSGFIGVALFYAIYCV